MWNNSYRSLWLYLVLLLCSCFLSPPLTSAITSVVAPKTLSCPVLRVPNKSAAQKLIDKTLENGLDARVYDTTSDGKPDVVTYTVPSGDLPLFYEVDDDGDNYPDRLYIDPERNGKCTSIKLYNDYTIPGHNEPNPESFPKWIVEGM